MLQIAHSWFRAEFRLTPHQSQILASGAHRRPHPEHSWQGAPGFSFGGTAWPSKTGNGNTNSHMIHAVASFGERWAHRGHILSPLLSIFTSEICLSGRSISHTYKNWINGSKPKSDPLNEPYECIKTGILPGTRQHLEGKTICKTDLDRPHCTLDRLHLARIQNNAELASNIECKILSGFLFWARVLDM